MQTKEKIWAGVVDLLDGAVLEEITYQKAKNADFHHTFQVSPQSYEGIQNGEYAYFFLDNGNPMKGDGSVFPSEIRKAILDRLESRIDVR